MTRQQAEVPTASATNRVSPRQHSSLPLPIRGRHASTRQQDIHVTRDQTSLRFRHHRSASRSVPAQAPSFSVYYCVISRATWMPRGVISLVQRFSVTYSSQSHCATWRRVTTHNRTRKISANHVATPRRDDSAGPMTVRRVARRQISSQSAIDTWQRMETNSLRDFLAKTSSLGKTAREARLRISMDLSSYASSQLDFFGHMSSPQSPQQSTSLEDMMKKLLDDQQRFHEELQQFSREFPSLQNLENQFIQLNATLQNMLDEKELCNTQPISYLEENVDVDTLSNVEKNVDTPVENYWRKTTQGLEVLPIEPDMSIAPNDDDDHVALEIGVISKRSEEPQIESKEDQPLVLVKPPTIPCIFDKPYMGVELKEHSQIFYTANTFVLEDHDVTDSFVLEVSNELPILKEGVHAALPKYADAPFVVDISKGEGIT
ncbi:hypothetical protein Syun_021572 [Stephania yunnanensis]|uniref:Uncharacterized protein n=1 Tax=Stephania yunnanensis TaxID=152371 RepID=A0AAP0NR75_9MAGN